VRQIHKRLTYANVMSSIAVFLVLGGGAAFAATQLPKNSVGTPQLKKNAVATGKIKAQAVATGKIKNQAVSAAKLADGAVITAKLADGSVITGKLADASITTPKIADNAVSTTKIADNAVSTTKIAPEAVTTGKIANEAVTTPKLANEAVKAAKLGPANFTLGTSVAVAAGATSASTLDCPAGTRLLSGGVLNSGTTKELVVLGSHPNTASQWRAQVYNSGASAHSYSIVVLCLLA